MKPSVLFTVVVFGLSGFVVAGGQSSRVGSYEDLVKDMLGTVDQITKVLTTIKDRDSAAAARSDLKKSAEKMLDLRKQAAEWKQPNKEEKDRLEKVYAPKLENAVKKLRDETIRVNGVPGGNQAVAELAILKDKENKDKKGGKQQ